MIIFIFLPLLLLVGCSSHKQSLKHEKKDILVKYDYIPEPLFDAQGLSVLHNHEKDNSTYYDYRVVATIDKVSKWYAAEMERLGWQLLAAELADENRMTLMYIKPRHACCIECRQEKKYVYIKFSVAKRVAQ